ncbi:MAG: ergothioneine biosynthesis protein EgtB [Planctomycetota bacterium]|jgi:ergothioneine biosynthesis protein EgtB
MSISNSTTPQRERLITDFEDLRTTTMALCEPLEPEDMVVQTMPDVSPTKWHLAHVTWFFETFVLARSRAPYMPFRTGYHELFNSYYQSEGKPFPRAQRGLLSRPTVDEVRAYRKHVDREVLKLIEHGPEEVIEQAAPIVEVGLQHEQQHQELLLMDVKHVLAKNPLRPAYRQEKSAPRAAVPALDWCSYAGGRVTVGATDGSFFFDNEGPEHPVLVQPFELASRLVTAGEYLEFMADGGYQRPEFWLADGWDIVQRENWRAPLYWEESRYGWQMMTLAGMRAVDPGEPVCHVSYYEADAFATWARRRLPTEFEWEHAARGQEVAGTFLESEVFHPQSLEESGEESAPAQLFGDVWEWTASAYAPYPRYAPFAGGLGEYNGKFMSNQMVLRGGCCVSPQRHLRKTYRNFYYPQQRWMFAGIRLAR